MPIFDFYCNSCGHETEILCRSDDKDTKQCPECNKATLIQQLSAPKIRLNGSGYYETDEKPKDKQRNVLRKEDASSSSSESATTNS